ncbi:MAG: SLBB domain-containing protein [Bacteroidetes bacterium]|nr:SLBB domain-containing protein [Bacteroidota bacterium]
MTTREFRDDLRLKLEKYLQSPTVRVTYNSYKVTVLGEVNAPGLYQASNEKLTITDAIGLAGDLTIFGDRKKVMLIREDKGKKSFNAIDLTKRDLFKSEYYYMHPGDILYIPAGKGRIASADTFYRIAPIVISSLTLLVLIARLQVN